MPSGEKRVLRAPFMKLADGLYARCVGCGRVLSDHARSDYCRQCQKVRETERQAAKVVHDECACGRRKLAKSKTCAACARAVGYSGHRKHRGAGEER